MPEAVIFGGSGFFGTHIARHLAAQPEISRIVIADIVEPRQLVEKAEYARVDVREPIALEIGPEPVVYNLAAIHTTPGHEDWEYFWTNVSGAIEVCRFAGRAGARRMVFTSSIAVYGPQETKVDETTEPRPVGPYGSSKLQAEKIHEDWQRADPARRLVVVRPAVTFGEGEQGNFTRLAALLRRGLFVYPVRRDAIKACAPVERLPSCIDYMAALDEPVIRFNYAYPERTTTEEINRAFCEAAGFAMPRLVVPGWFVNAAALGFEVLGGLGIRTPINRARVQKLVHSTNVYPAELVARGWAFGLTLPEALRRWKEASDFK
jgi:nucleoside-diphosphate-sugar epimerase